MALLAAGRVVVSPNTGQRYRVTNRLEAGATGETYRATRVGSHRPVCLKVTRDQVSWHREVLTAQLLSSERRVVRVLDAFQARTWIRGGLRAVFCIVEELASHGDLIAATEEGWRCPASRASREVLGLLRALDRLHRSAMSHGDLSPANILVFDSGVLKLGDLGSAAPAAVRSRQQSLRWNPIYAPRGYRGDLRDDVWFMGQLLAMLLEGDASRPRRPREIAQLPCRAAVRRVIRRATGPADQRYPDAAALGSALRRAA